MTRFFLKHIFQINSYVSGQYVLFNHAPSFCRRSYKHVDCERIGGTGPKSKSTQLFYRTCFSRRSNLQLLLSTSAFLITAHETKQWPFFHAASFTCAFGKKRSTCINIFWRTIKQNNKGLLQRFMFNRMPRLQPFQRQFFEMKLVSKVGNIAFNPWEFIILANRTAKFSSCRT